MIPNQPKRNESVTQQRLGEETLVYTSESESVHVLNKTAGFIWSLCDGKRSIREIEEEIRNNYKLEPEADVGNDLIRVLNDLSTKNLIQSDLK